MRYSGPIPFKDVQQPRPIDIYARPFTKSDWLELAMLALAQAGLPEHDRDRVRDMVTF